MLKLIFGAKIQKVHFLSINSSKINEMFETKILKSKDFQFDFWRENSNISLILLI